MLEVEIAILGAGTAGMSAFNAARKHTSSVIMLEGGQFGTTCARVGCMPSKLLIAAANKAQALQDAPHFGVHLNAGYTVNGKEVMHRVRSERDRFVNFVLQDLEAIPSNQLIAEMAHFVSPNQLVTASGKQIKARNIIIATGSRPAIPVNLTAAQDRLIINDDVFNWDNLPESIAVFGAGVIGLELSQALSRLGVRTRLFSRSNKLGPLTSPELQQLAVEYFATELNLSLGATLEQVKPIQNGVELSFTEVDGQLHTETFSYVLAATGRIPNLAKLNLAAAKLKLNAKGQPEFNPETGQCVQDDGQPASIFIAGDVANFRPLLHEANDEGYIAGLNAANWPNLKINPRRTPLSVVFTEPQMAIAGETLKQLHTRLGTNQVAIGRSDFSRQGRARVMLVNQGAMEVYACKTTGKLLGAELFGPEAEHLIHLLAWVIQQQLTVVEILALPFYHPVVEEGMRTALRSVARLIK